MSDAANASDLKRIRNVVDELHRLGRRAVAEGREGNLDELLRKVGDALCGALGISRYAIYLRDDDHTYHGRVGSSGQERFDAEVRRLTLQPARDPIAREVIETGQAVLVEDVRSDPRPPRRTVERWGSVDLLVLPLLSGDDVLGVVMLDDDGVPHDYGEYDVELALSFASLMSVAVEQVDLLGRVRRRADVIDRQRSEAVLASDAHKRLTQGMIDGRSADELVASVAELTGRPAALISSQDRLVCVADATDIGLGDTLSRSWRPAIAAMRYSVPARKRSTIAQPVTDLGVPVRALLAPLHARGIVLGTLALFEFGRPFSNVERLVAEEAATVLTLQALEVRQRRQDLRQESDDFFNQLLAGGARLPALVRRAPHFGLDPKGAYVLVRVGEEGDCSLKDDPLQDLCLSLAEEADPIVSTKVPGATVHLIRVRTSNPGDSIRRLAEQAGSRIDSLGGLVVISNLCSGLEAVPDCWVEVEEVAVALAERSRAPRVMNLGEVRLGALMLRSTDPSVLCRYAEGLLGPLQADRTSESLLSTLASFCRNDGKVRATARAVGVHENTIRYRLSGIATEVGVDPMSPRGLMEFQAALDVWALLMDEPDSLWESTTAAHTPA